MKTRLNYILISATVCMMALSADALSSKNGTSGTRSQAEISPEAIDSIFAPKIPPFLKFADAAEALAYMQKSEHSAEYMQGILPQMAKDELSYTEKLLNNTHDGFIVVDKSRMKVIKFDRYGVEQESFGMACAKNYGTKHKKADSRTPEGFFSVKQVQNSSEWRYVDDDGNVSEKTGEFGPRFIRLNTPVSTQIGIHGTSAPWSIGGRRSHGCIRLTNENIMRLVEMVDSGMPVIVSPGKKDMAVNQAEGYHIPAINTVAGAQNLAYNN